MFVDYRKLKRRKESKGFAVICTFSTKKNAIGAAEQSNYFCFVSEEIKDTKLMEFLKGN